MRIPCIYIAISQRSLLVGLGELLHACAAAPGTAPTAFHRFSTDDQKLVLHGHVRTGLTRTPFTSPGAHRTDTSRTAKENEASETWLYERQLTIYRATRLQRSVRSVPRAGQSAGAAVRCSRASDYGGVWRRGLARYQPHVRVIDVRYQRADFVGRHTARTTRTGATVRRTGTAADR